MDIIDFAINMELDGEKYYTKRAEINKDNALSPVFLQLAKDEAYHARLIKEFKEELLDPDKLSAVTSAKSVFDDVNDEINKMKELPDQLDAYRYALEIEQKSIDLYRKLLDENSESKKLFQFLIEQEKIHYRIIDDIVQMVNRPNDWVEDAEFGLRDKY